MWFGHANPKRNDKLLRDFRSLPSQTIPAATTLSAIWEPFLVDPVIVSVCLSARDRGAQCFGPREGATLNLSFTEASTPGSNGAYSGLINAHSVLWQHTRAIDFTVHFLCHLVWIPFR